MSLTAEYTYGIDNIRRSKTVNGTTQKFIWDGANIVGITDATGTITDKYYRGVGLIASYTDSLNYYQTNDHGDVSAWGDISYSYDAFGNQESETVDGNPFRYCGEYSDAESGLIYLRARMYDPSTGRFINEDPIRDGLNWYVYCENNPVMFVDPWGLIPSAKDAAEMAARSYWSESQYNPKIDIEKRKLGDGWRLIDVWDGSEGVFVHIYVRGDGGNSSYTGEKEYAFVNKGTTTGADWLNNAQQIIGLSTDMAESVEMARFFTDGDWGDYEVTFIGHSKGGAEATANALATNRNAIIFNPAELSFSSLITNGINVFDYSKKITSYTVIGEPLSIINTFVNYGIPYLSKPLPFYSFNPKKNHSIEAVRVGISKWYH